MRRLACVLVLGCCGAGAVNAYEIDGWKWGSSQTTFHVSIPGASGAWNSAFQQALDRWTAVTAFTYQSSPDFADPCVDPGSTPFINGVAFAATVCGDAWGTNVLAVTYTWGSGNTFLQADIIFNSGRSWSVYSGPWQGTAEFRRVAVHELGHALGLSHETGAPAIMAPIIGNIETPTADDVAGVAALYGAATLTDTDHDGVADTSDNCTLRANSDQRDSDGDGYGNTCDADLNNSGMTTTTDSNLLRSVLDRTASSSALAAAADMNGSGLVTSTDYSMLRARINTESGPSGLHP